MTKTRYKPRPPHGLKCAHCGEWFRDLKTWQSHRHGPIHNRRCMTTGELRALGYRKSPHKRWFRATPEWKRATSELKKRVSAQHRKER